MSRSGRSSTCSRSVICVYRSFTDRAAAAFPVALDPNRPFGALLSTSTPDFPPCLLCPGGQDATLSCFTADLAAADPSFGFGLDILGAMGFLSGSISSLTFATLDCADLTIAAGPRAAGGPIMGKVDA